MRSELTTQQHNEADDQTLLSQLRLCIVNGKNEIKTSSVGYTGRFSDIK